MDKFFLVACVVFLLGQISVSNAKPGEPVIRAVTEAFRHGEGPVWDEKNQLLYFVDAFNATLVRYDPKTDKIDTVTLPNHRSVGVILPKKSDSREFFVGADRDVYSLKWGQNGDQNLTHLITIETDKPMNQFNDGKVDALGNIWIGTLHRDSDLSVPPYGGSLYRIKMPQFKIEEKLSNVSISNGIAWSKDQKSMFYIDSYEKQIWKFRCNLKNGTIDDKRILFSLKPDNNAEHIHITDGMTIDTDDNLWVAIFGGGQILKIDGENGTVLQTIEMPCKYVTSCSFGGPNLNVLYATTSKLHLSEEEIKQQPVAGATFEITNLGVKGFPCNRANDKGEIF